MVNELLHPLRKWRIEEGLTLDAAAAGVGTFRGTWYDWEIGRRIPDRDYMPRVCRFCRYEIMPNHFYFPQGVPEPFQIELPLDSGAAPLLERVDNAQPESVPTPLLQDAA